MATLALILALTAVGFAESDPTRVGTYESWGFDRYEQVELPATRTKVALYFAGNNHEDTVILVHGLGQSGVSDWQYLVPRLKERYRVIGLDLPGFGDSKEEVFEPSPRIYAKLIKNIVDRYGKGDIHVVGHSMGGAVALWFAGQYPNALKTLTVVDAAGVLHKAALFDAWSTPPKSGGLFNRALQYAEANINQFKLKLLDKTNSISEVLLAPAKYTFPFQQKVAMQLIDADFSKVIFDVKVPTLIIWGNEDYIAPMRTALALRRILPKTDLVILAAAHVPMKESTTSFNRSLLDWLEDPRTKANVEQPPPEDAQDGECKDQNGKMFQGDFASIIINHCKNVVLDNVRSSRITIDGSEVLIESSYFEGNHSPTVTIRNSFVVITGSEFKGKIPLAIYNSRVDFAGSLIHGTPEATSTEDDPANLLYSISKKTVRGRSTILHGYREVTKEP